MLTVAISDLTLGAAETGREPHIFNGMIQVTRTFLRLCLLGRRCTQEVLDDFQQPALHIYVA